MKSNRLLPLVLLLTALSAHAKDFIIYDRMDYVGKPDLTADKLSKVFLVYESELVKPDPTSKRKHGVLNEARIRELAKQSRREGYRTISTDIESWFAEKDGQLLTPDELRTDFARMYQIFREENPRAVISNYGMPSEHLHGIRHYRPNVDNETILAKWRQVSKRRAPTAAISDYANPVFYITSPDLVQWEKDVKTAVDDIHQRFPNKKSSATFGRNIIQPPTALISNSSSTQSAGAKCSKSAKNTPTA